MPNGEQAYINADVLRLVEKESHTQQEQEMIVSRNHVFGAKVCKRQILFLWASLS